MFSTIFSSAREESVTGYKSLPSLFPTDAENSFEVDK